MGKPRVFISSTCRDLRDIRQELQEFIAARHYEAVLSEKGAVYYNPDSSAVESCYDEVATCQLFVLIIGGRYGSTDTQTGKSITNGEYRRAVKEGIPIFVAVDEGVWHDYGRYCHKDEERRASFDTQYDRRVFGFIEEVLSEKKNNGIQPFKNVADVKDYLNKQWAGLVYSLLKNKGAVAKIATQKQTDELRAYREIDVLYSASMFSEKISVSQILHFKSYEAVLNNLGVFFDRQAGNGRLITLANEKGVVIKTVQNNVLATIEARFKELRTQLLQVLARCDVDIVTCLNHYDAKSVAYGTGIIDVVM